MTTIEQEAKEISNLVPKLMTGIKGSFMLSEDVTPQQMLTIFTINEIGTCKVSTLSRRMGISAPTATGIVDRLVRNGYVERFRDTEDRRIVFVKVTKEGETFVGKFKKLIQKKWKQILGYLTEQDRADYIRILKKLMQAFDQEKAKHA
jgi:DNA-binding MarR family transcriptional regulator